MNESALWAAITSGNSAAVARALAPTRITDDSIAALKSASRQQLAKTLERAMAELYSWRHQPAVRRVLDDMGEIAEEMRK